VHDAFVHVTGEELVAFSRDDAVDDPGVAASLLAAPTR
jgi:hypothetical protein